MIEKYQISNHLRLYIKSLSQMVTSTDFINTCIHCSIKFSPYMSKISPFCEFVLFLFSFSLPQIQLGSSEIHEIIKWWPYENIQLRAVILRIVNSRFWLSRSGMMDPGLLDLFSHVLATGFKPRSYVASDCGKR